MQITAPTLEWMALSPLIALFLGACLGIALEAIVPRSYRYLVQTFTAALTLIVALVLLILNWTQDTFGIMAMGAVTLDGPAYFFLTLLLILGFGGLALFAERQVGGGQSAFAASAAAVPGSPLERQAEAMDREHTEIFPMLLFALFGMGIFATANNLLVMFVALEIFSLPLYLLSGMARRRRLLSQEAALKYFLLGAFSSGFFIYGVALLYGYSGSLTLGGIADAISAGANSWILLVTGMALMAVGLLFKVGAVPFHSWTPDVYAGAPTPVTGFMAAATKTAAVAALLRVFYIALGGAQWNWQPIIAIIAVATMVIGAVVAVVQTDVKRLLAYSSIAHAGFILVGMVGAVAAGTTVAVSSVAAIGFYLLTYGMATLGAFALVTMVRRAGGEATALSAWHGLGKTNPGVAGLMTLFLLSFAGIPPTAGFIGKLGVFQSAWVGGYGWLVLVAVLVSAVAAYVYLKLIVVMWFKQPVEGETAEVVTPSLWTWCVLVVTAIATLVLGIVPGGVLNLAVQASQFIR